MKILIVSATKFEVAHLMHLSKKNNARENITTIHFGKHAIDILVTGVGMTATAFHLGRTLIKKYDLAINAGIAGSFRKNIPLGEMVNIVNDCFADLGAEDGEKFVTAKELKLVESLEFRMQNPNTIGHRLSVVGQLRKVKGITVNTVHGNTSSIKKVVSKFNPDVESMEGAAFFYSCQKNKIPCIQIRSISNYVEKRNKKKWEVDLAIKNLNSFLVNFLLNS